MPHQCVRCGNFFDDGAAEILKGCKCGGKLFFYIRKEKLEKAKQVAKQAKLSEKEKTQIEEDAFNLVGVDKEKGDPIILDLESIKIKKPGQYELDLVHLFKGDPLIFKLEDGKYMIDVVESFKKLRDKKRK
jgi:predicted  nucleic acid-binding Zn-ribbon protein